MIFLSVPPENFFGKAGEKHQNGNRKKRGRFEGQQALSAHYSSIRTGLPVEERMKSLRSSHVTPTVFFYYMFKLCAKNTKKGNHGDNCL